jgi:hypothetical protein
MGAAKCLMTIFYDSDETWAMIAVQQSDFSSDCECLLL